MMVYVTLKKAIELTPEEEAQCRVLSFGDEGYLCEDLDAIMETEQGRRYRYSHVYLVSETEGSPIIGWILIQPRYRSPNWEAQLFVDPAYRGRGIGTLLLQNANYFARRRVVCYLDDDNEGFFAKVPHLHTEV